MIVVVIKSFCIYLKMWGNQIKMDTYTMFRKQTLSAVIQLRR